MHIKFKYRTVILLAVIFVMALPATIIAGGINDANTENIESGRPTIGIVHITFEPSFFFDNVYYQSFDLSFRRQWESLAKENDFNLVQVEGGFGFDSTDFAIQRLINLDVDAILLYQHEPSAISRAVDLADEAGIPIAIHGIRPQQNILAPYVGFSEYESCYELGEKFAQFIKEQKPGKPTKGIILNSRTVQSDINREQGFIDGYRSVLPDATILNNREDNGEPENILLTLNSYFVTNTDIDFIYGTSDIRAKHSADFVRERGLNSAFVAGVGGSKYAMQELLDTESPWIAETALNIQGSAEKSYEILKKMIDGEITTTSQEEYLVRSEAFINPKPAVLEEYARVNHGIENLGAEN